MTDSPRAYGPLDVMRNLLEESQRLELAVKSHKAHLLDVEFVHCFLGFNVTPLVQSMSSHSTA